VPAFTVQLTDYWLDENTCRFDLLFEQMILHFSKSSSTSPVSTKAAV